MKLIRFKRINSDTWEIAYSKKDLDKKLNNDIAEVLMPAECLLKRLWVKIFPMKFKKISICEEVKP